MTQFALEISKLDKTYGQTVHALKSIDLKSQKDHFLASLERTVQVKQLLLVLSQI